MHAHLHTHTSSYVHSLYLHTHCKCNPKYNKLFTHQKQGSFEMSVCMSERQLALFITISGHVLAVRSSSFCAWYLQGMQCI